MFLKFDLLSISLKKNAYTKTLLDRKLLPVISLKAEEWRSKGPDQEGINPSYSQQLVTLKYDKPTNLIFIVIRDMNRLGEKVAEAQTKANVFLENGSGNELAIPLLKEEDPIGEIRFRT